MAKQLVAFFSVSGNTKNLASRMACAKSTDLFEIVPEKAYTAEDLDFMNPESRSSVEMKDLSCRPVVVSKLDDTSVYDKVFLGFPLWWGREPSIIDTFLESYDFEGKTIIPFCTSGMGMLGSTPDRICTLLDGKAKVEKGGRLIKEVKDEDLAIWPCSPEVREDEKELVKAFHMMWDNYNEQVRLIDRKFRVVAGNKAYMAFGGLTNVPCNIGNPELHKGCKAMACLKNNETMIKSSEVNGVKWDSYWVPVEGYPDYYVHFTNGLLESLTKMANG